MSYTAVIVSLFTCVLPHTCGLCTRNWSIWASLTDDYPSTTQSRGLTWREQPFTSMRVCFLGEKNAEFSEHGGNRMLWSMAPKIAQPIGSGGA